jgi:3-oxoacyl-[acyl-carrier-protein] synthase II
MTRRRVVVTGLGATTPLGGDVATTWAGLLAGKSGVRSLTEDWAQTIPVTFAARVAVEPSEQMERVEIRRLDRSEQFGLIASREAWKDAGSPEIDKERLGVVVASGIGGVTTLLEQYDILNGKGARLVSPHTVPMLMPNGPAANIGLELQAQAGVHTPVSACASGAEAIGYAFEMIRNNRADIVVSGGVEAACHALPMAAFAAMKALSTRNDDPARACRPFDRDRDGFVMGEGAGILILEELEHAINRGARIYGEIVGYGMTCDAYHMTSPVPGGLGAARAIELALKDGALIPEMVSYINAHGTSTQANDVNETAAIKKALGDHAYKVAISSTKSMTGHLLGAAGAVEAIAVILAMKYGIVPPTINHTVVDENIDPSLNLTLNVPQKRDIKVAMSNTFGFGGHNACVLFKKLED